MYRKHFAFTAFPFDLTLKPEELFASAALTEAQARLKHLLELRGIGLLTGEAGCGKTTVLAGDNYFFRWRQLKVPLPGPRYRVFDLHLSPPC